MEIVESAKQAWLEKGKWVDDITALVVSLDVTFDETKQTHGDNVDTIAVGTEAVVTCSSEKTPLPLVVYFHSYEKASTTGKNSKANQLVVTNQKQAKIQAKAQHV